MSLNVTSLGMRLYPTVVGSLVKHYARRLTHLRSRRSKQRDADLERVSTRSSCASSADKRKGSHRSRTKRFKRRSNADTESELADEQAMYDLSLAVVRMFIKAMSRDTVEALQSFVNIALPVPPHVRVQPTHIPTAAILKAASTITDVFTDDLDGRPTLDPLLGGHRWWQVRPGPLVAEWVVPSQTVRRRAAEKGTRKRDRLRKLFLPLPASQDSRTSLASTTASAATLDISATEPHRDFHIQVPTASRFEQDTPASDGVVGSGTQAGLTAAHQSTAVREPGLNNVPSREMKVSDLVRGARRNMSKFRQASKQSTHLTANSSAAEHADHSFSGAPPSASGAPARKTDPPMTPMLTEGLLSAEPAAFSETEGQEHPDSDGSEIGQDNPKLPRALSQHGERHGPTSQSGVMRDEPRHGYSTANCGASQSVDDIEAKLGNDPTEQEPFDIDPRRFERIMLYCHGGAYYFGSNDTHRVMIARYARDLDGAAFSIEYRLAPQYPFPCGLHDLLAAYLYLISPPPPSANASPRERTSPTGADSLGTGWGMGVDPAKIVLSGDSAGGGMILALLQVLRDTGYPLPAGAALISPWSDLTHSFPSIMTNLKKDYIPSHGFIHKPSPLWPPPKDTNIATTAPASLCDGHHHLGHSVIESALHQEDVQARGRIADLSREMTSGPSRPAEGRHAPPEAFEAAVIDQRNVTAGPPPPDSGNYPDESHTSRLTQTAQAVIDSFGPRSHLQDPVLTVDLGSSMSKAGPNELKIRDQIQLYATNGQLTHPLVSPALAGSLGGLPPLYILAGNNEALRDEIVWVAHRAAHPAKYPLPPHLVQQGTKRTVEAQKRYDHQPTLVHLQVWDDGVHVMPAFEFTYPGHLMYHAVASFCKAVTGAPIEQLPRTDTWKPEKPPDGTGSPDDGPGRREFPYSKHEPIERPTYRDGMIRERISMHGIVRPMEPEDQMAALSVPRERIGVIQPGPAGLFCEANRAWAHKFRREPKRVAQARETVRREAQAALGPAQADADVVRGVQAALPNHYLSPGHVHQYHWGHSKSPAKPHAKNHAAPSAVSAARGTGTTSNALPTSQQDESDSAPPTTTPQTPPADGLSTPATSLIPHSQLQPGPEPHLGLHLVGELHRHSKPVAFRGHGYVVYTHLDLVGETPPAAALAGRIDTVEALDLLQLGIEEVRRRGQALRGG